MSEGFHPAWDVAAPFNVVLAVEKDPSAIRTLWLRSVLRKLVAAGRSEYYRQAIVSSAPEAYLREYCPEETELADNATLRAELGNANDCPESYLDERIRFALDGRDDWVLIGGPPCQAFSRAGKARRRGDASYRIEDDDRVMLYRQYLRIVRKHRPAAFVLENVPDMLATQLDDVCFRHQLLDELAGDQELRWRLYATDGNEIHSETPAHKVIVGADEFGLPQSRKRLIIVGIREDLVGGPDALVAGEQLTPSNSVLAGLPLLRSGISRGRDDPELWKSILRSALQSDWLAEADGCYGDQIVQTVTEAVAEANANVWTRGTPIAEFGDIEPPQWMPDWYVGGGLGLVLNHHSKEHMPDDLHRYLFTSSFGRAFGISPRLSNFPSDLMPGHKNAGSGKFQDRFRVQLGDRAASTITSHLAKDGHFFIHPDPAQCRSLTVREAARLQTFPDDYFFMGPKSAQYVQVGNAVPPYLAKLVAGSLEPLFDTEN